jgi:hypothetical protein
MKPKARCQISLTFNLKPLTLISRRNAMKPKFLKSNLVVLAVLIISFSLLTFLPTRVMSQQVFQLAVPYHSQIPQWQWPAWGEPGNPRYPNGWCTVACLDMIFDYYDAMGHPNPPLPQQEIACVANTNNPGGTWETDARRAAHFSQTSKSLNQPSWPGYWNGIGYSWRGPAGGSRLGYAAVGSDVAGNWKNISNMQGLKNFLLNGCPLIVYLDIDSLNAYADSAETTYENPPDSLAGSCPVTREGHAEVLLGYDDRNPAKPTFIVHDPGIFANGIGGRSITWPQNLFYNSIWTGRYLYCAPWVINRGTLPLGWGAPAPDNWNVLPGKNVRVDVQGTYPGPVPLKGFYAVNNPKSTLTPGQFVIQAGANPQNLRNVNKTGSASPAPGQWNAVCWTLTAPNNGGVYPISIEIKGTTGNLNSNSYANYTDDIGRIKTYNLSVIKLVVDPGHPPFGHGLGDPWNNSGILWAPQPNPGSPCSLKAVIYNYGEVSVPAGALVNFYYSDPHTCQHYPDYSLHSIGSATIPPIPPGDSAMVGPVLFTPPTTGNSFGESFFDIFTTIYCSQDTIQTGWVLEDNNVAVKSFWTAQTLPGVPFTMHFLAKNYLDGPGQMVLGIDREELPGGWTAQLDLPEDSLILLPPGAQIPVMLTVTPTPCHLAGKVWVFESLYDSAGNFVRTTGGIGFEVRTSLYSDDFNDCNLSDWTVYTSSGTFGTTDTQYVSPPCGLYMSSQGSGYAWGRTPNITLDTTQDFTISTYFKVPNSNNHWFWVLDNDWVNLVIDYGTDLSAYQGSHGPALNLATLDTNRWYLIEAEVHPATSNYKVYLDRVYKGTANFPANYLRYLRLGEFENGGANYGQAYWDDLLVSRERPYLLGDATGDGVVDASDVVYLLNYLFVNGPEPKPLEAGDANCDGVVDIADVVYLLNYLFVGGPSPTCDGKSSSTELDLKKLNQNLNKAKIGLFVPTLPEGNLRRLEQQCEIAVWGKFDQDIAGLQLEISYDPKEITLLKPELTSLTSDLSIFYGGKEGLQKIGIVDVSGKNLIPSGEGALVTLKAKGINLGSVRIEKAILVDREAHKIPVEIVSEIKKSDQDLTTGETGIPQEFSLSANYPNPFNPETEIKYALPKDCHVTLAIYNILGEKVKVLVDEQQSAGYRRACWDGKSDKGEEVASGVYFYRLETKEFSQVKKMMLVK